MSENLNLDPKQNLIQSQKTNLRAEIEKLSHDGRGIARIDGKTTFIQGALPQETVNYTILRKKKDFDEAKLVGLIKASEKRVEPRCPHYAFCGGCSMQHMDENLQIDEKQRQFLDLLQRFAKIKPEQLLEPLRANSWHYRNKARLSVRYVEKKQTALVGFREKNNPRYIAEIDQCPILNQAVDAEIPHLKALISSFSDPLSIAQIEVAAGDEAVALIFRNLSPLEAGDEDKLRAFAMSNGFRIYLQPKGPDSVKLFYPEDGENFLHYSLPEQNVKLKFYPTDFTQVNSGLNRKMVAKALELLSLNKEDNLLDLFCGLGNFSIPMAKHCGKLIAIEGSQDMVERAAMNAADNQVNNVQFIAGNLDDDKFVSGLASFKANKILLDPPRSGALELVKQMNLLNPDLIVYVSCNPASFARDADILINEHAYRLLAAGVMDMFPQTMHVESIALFKRT